MKNVISKLSECGVVSFALQNAYVFLPLLLTLYTVGCMFVIFVLFNVIFSPFLMHQTYLHKNRNSSGSFSSGSTRPYYTPIHTHPRTHTRTLCIEWINKEHWESVPRWNDVERVTVLQIFLFIHRILNTRLYCTLRDATKNHGSTTIIKGGLKTKNAIVHGVVVVVANAFF